MRLVIDLQGAQGASRFRGIGRYSRELALAMARQPGPHDVVVALNAALPAEELIEAFGKLLPPENIRLWETPGNTAAVDSAAAGRRAASALLRAEFFASLQPDLVHVSSLFEGASDDVMACWPSSLERLPFVATCYDLIPLIRRDVYLDGPWKGGPVATWYFRQLRELSLCQGLLAISESSRREAIEYLGYPAERVHNVRAGISPRFAPRQLTAEQTAALHARYGLRPRFILFVGGGDLRKNEAGLIRAYGLLPEALRARHQLVIVGKTDPDELARSAEAAQVPLAQIAAVRFVEEEDLPALYTVCAVSVLPSLHEGFGLPAGEAMACGAPTIASNNSSLPEVLGRADALFDAEDPADIAARLQAVLTDAAFRQSLVEHGKRQAATFTWEDSAWRAWAALEAIDAETPRPRPSAPLRRLPRLAFVSPLPPQQTGIASYAAELLPALSRHYDITLVCDHGATDDEALNCYLPAITPQHFLAEADRFDRVLYQIGNSHFHLSQLEMLLPAQPGVVTLHDAYLSGALLWRAWQSGEPRRFLVDLLRSHGWAAVVKAERLDLDVAQGCFPCTLPVLRTALGIVQHSAHARSILAEHFGEALAARSRLIPSLRQIVPLPSRQAARRALGVPADAFLVCSFGIVARTKMPEQLMAGFAAFARDVSDARLIFVGEPLREVLELFPTADSDAAPRATGRVDTATYRRWLAAADVAVQLRTASRGETSAAVTDCLGAGLATVVNAHGALDELPGEVVVKLPFHFSPDQLATALRQLQHEPAMRESLGQAARHYVATTLDPDRIALAYRDVIEAAYADGPELLRHRLTQEAGALLSNDGADLAAVARAIGGTFPTPRPPQLLLACGEVDSLPEPMRALLRQCLTEHSPTLRVHPVKAEGGRLVQDWASACKLLDLASLPGKPPAAETGAGDVLVEVIEGAVDPAALAACRRRGVRVVPLSAAGLDSAAAIPGLLAWEVETAPVPVSVG
jgi:glycosyltransferase involved in cell wall biosynthesis